MKKDIILAGVGGQGILSIATVIGYIAVNQNLYLKQSEVHGMSQRGGDVSSHLRISNKTIASDLIPKGKADMILSVEPLESLRYLPYLSSEGWIVTNNKPFVNIPNYPEIEKVLSTIQQKTRYILIDADKIAKESGSARSANMVMLGAASPFLGFDDDCFINAMKAIFGRKGDDIVEKNILAFKAGKTFAASHS